MLLMLSNRRAKKGFSAGFFGNGGHKNGEFIAAKAHYNVIAAAGILQGGGNGNDHGIAYRVAKGVVDGFEFVAVDQAQKAAHLVLQGGFDQLFAAARGILCLSDPLYSAVYGAGNQLEKGLCAPLW